MRILNRAMASFRARTVNRVARFLHDAQVRSARRLLPNYRLPEVALEMLPGFNEFDDVAAGGEGVAAHLWILDGIGLPCSHTGGDHDDAEPLFRIAHAARPKVILELGTAYGNTTANLCRLCPAAKIFTVNALPDQMSGRVTTFDLSQQDIGRVYRDHGFANRVTQIYANTIDLNLDRQLTGSVLDLAIIDACHDTEYVVSDFHKVRPFLAQGGLVLLHDTHPSMAGHLLGSYRACMLLRREGFDVRHLRSTWWGVWRNDAAAWPAQP